MEPKDVAYLFETDPDYKKNYLDIEDILGVDNCKKLNENFKKFNESSNNKKTPDDFGTDFFIVILLIICDGLNNMSNTHIPLELKPKDRVLKRISTNKKNIIKELKNEKKQRSKRLDSVYKKSQTIKSLLDEGDLGRLIFLNVPSGFITNRDTLFANITSYIKNKENDKNKLENLINQLKAFESNAKIIITYIYSITPYDWTVLKSLIYKMVSLLFSWYKISFPKAQHDDGTPTRYCCVVSFCSIELLNLKVSEDYVKIVMNQMYETNKKKNAHNKDKPIGSGDRRDSIEDEAGYPQNQRELNPPKGVRFGITSPLRDFLSLDEKFKF